MPENQFPEKNWLRQDSIVFCRTTEAFGPLSNMAAGYPLTDPDTGLAFQSSEGLYQAAKFPHDPARQRRIAVAPNAYTAKQVAYAAGASPAADWEDRKVDAMRRALHRKLAQHPERFGALLLQTGDQPIVEYSGKGDRFWSAVNAGLAGQLKGRNVLGVLLMELRARFREHPQEFHRPRRQAQPAPAAKAAIPESAAAAKAPAGNGGKPDFGSAMPHRDQAMDPAAARRSDSTNARSAMASPAAQARPAAPEAPEPSAGNGQYPDRIGNTRISTIQPTALLSPGNGFMSEYYGSLNPYSGCSFGCGYCYAANFTRSQRDQDEWGRWVQIKENLDRLLDQVPPGTYNGQVLYMSTVTDPYQPVERKTGIVRRLLTRLAAEHPRLRLVVQTRSPLAVRDQDLFQQIRETGGKVQVNFTVTTDSEAVRKAYEPGCPSIPARLKAAAAMQQAGIQTAITATPMLPLQDCAGFIETLKSTGVTRYIIQPFKLPTNPDQAENGRFIARTDRKAVELTAAHYGQPAAQAARSYQDEYRRHREQFRRAFPGLGEGKDGFRPPWPRLQPGI